MKDKYGREMDYLRISLTENCNLRCVYCMPNWDPKECFSEKQDELTEEEVTEVVKLFSKLGIKKIRLTGGEPLLRKDLKGIIKNISEIEGIKEICITTNGLLLFEKIDELYKNGLNRINISLDTLNSEEYKKITRGGELEKVLQGIKRARELKIHVKINAVITNLQNKDSVEELVKFTENDEIDVRFIELMPIGEGKNLKGLKGEEIISILKDRYIIEDLYSFEGTSKYYKIKGAKGRIGLINPMSQCFCESCNRVRVTSSLELKTCLSSNEKINLRDILSLDLKEKEKLSIIRDILYNKNKENIFNTDKEEKKNMNTIGG
ncbi:MAG: GTP 3',8-cyclase MoaA [Fusobacteriaceae bacterium]